MIREFLVSLLVLAMISLAGLMLFLGVTERPGSYSRPIRLPPIVVVPAETTLAQLSPSTGSGKVKIECLQCHAATERFR